MHRALFLCLSLSLSLSRTLVLSQPPVLNNTGYQANGKPMSSIEVNRPAKSHLGTDTGTSR